VNPLKILISVYKSGMYAHKGFLFLFTGIICIGSVLHYQVYIVHCVYLNILVQTDKIQKNIYTFDNIYFLGNFFIT